MASKGLPKLQFYTSSEWMEQSDRLRDIASASRNLLPVGLRLFTGHLGARNRLN